MSLASASFDVPATDHYAHDWALVDVETSGLVARRDRVLSVAVVTIGPDGEQTGSSRRCSILGAIRGRYMCTG